MIYKAPLKIGTRGSDLALWQAREVAKGLALPSTIEVVKTEGDKRLDIALQGTSATGFFTKDIERRLAAKEVDIAVHSLKDLPTQLDPSLAIAAILPRAPVNDLLLVHPEWYEEGEGLPLRKGCVVGAGSLRRQSLVRLYAKGAKPQLIRGNVPTRVGKCRSGEYGAVVVARAGVERLDLDLAPLQTFELSTPGWLPAPGQGAVAVEIRSDDVRAREALSKINDEPTELAVGLERRLLSNFEGGCHTAFGALAKKSAKSKNVETWIVDFGIDRGELGWGQARFTGAYSECTALDRGVISQMKPPLHADIDQLLRGYEAKQRGR